MIEHFALGKPTFDIAPPEVFEEEPVVEEVIEVVEEPIEVIEEKVPALERKYKNITDSSDASF